VPSAYCAFLDGLFASLLKLGRMSKIHHNYIMVL
jgi:hypothetical protein